MLLTRTWLSSSIGWFLIAAMFAYGPAAHAGEAEIEPELLPPPKITRPAPTKQQLIQRRKVMLDEVTRKILQAKLMFKLKRLQQCIDLCDEILAMNPGDKRARLLKARASKLRLSEQTAKLDAERVVRDHALLEEATREGLPEPFGPKLPRPKIREEDMPFSDSFTHRKEQEKLLGQVIPEINLIETDLNYLLQLLFKTTGVNIVYTPDDVADKSITIHARNLTLNDILKYICRTQEMGFTVDKGTVWIYSAANTAAAKALMKPVVIPLRVGLTSSASDAGALSSTGGGADDGGDDGADLSDIEDTLTWMEENWPGWPPETKWRLDKKFNRLIIASTPDIIRDVRDMVNMLDAAPVQVLIVARFVEVKENLLDGLGFNWNLNPSPMTSPARDANGNLLESAWRDNKVRMSSTAMNLGVAGDTLTTGAVAIINEHELKMTMQLINSRTGSKVLTAPRVIALNNKKAAINISDKLPFQNDVEVQQHETVVDNRSVSQSVVTPVWDTVDIGFSLEVIPSVGADMKTINLWVHPTITDKSGDVPFPVTVVNDNQVQTINLSRPIIKTQEISVRASITDNGTLVVGGLFRDNFSEAKKQVPILGKIPGLGHLFRSKNNTRDRTAMLIFITAKILTPGNSTYTDDVRQARKHFNEYDAITNRNVSPDILDSLLGDPQEK